MFKFLVYLFLFYGATRFIFGTLLNFKQHTSSTKVNIDTEEEEIKIKAKPTSKNKSKTSSSNIGEYVDFEEIK